MGSPTLRPREGARWRVTHTLYEKRGRRYVPVAEENAFAGIPEGWWLVHVKPGGLSSRRMLTPAHAEVEAAMRLAEDVMVEAMRRKQGASDLNPRPYRDPAKARRAWKAWADIMGDETMLCFDGVSMRDVVDAGLDALRKHMGIK